MRGHNLLYGLVGIGLFLPSSIILHIEPGMPLGVVPLTRPALLGPTSNKLFPITRGIYAVFAGTQRQLIRAAVAGSVKG